MADDHAIDATFTHIKDGLFALTIDGDGWDEKQFSASFSMTTDDAETLLRAILRNRVFVEGLLTVDGLPLTVPVGLGGEPRIEAMAALRRADNSLYGLETEVRPEVRSVAYAMEDTLRRHDNKGGWENCEIDYLITAFLKEFGELLREIYPVYNQEGVCRESIDCINFLMMLWDNCQAGRYR